MTWQRWQGRGRWQQCLEGTPFCWVGWGFEKGHCGSVSLFVGIANISEAFENCHQAGVFPQVDLAEECEQHGGVERLLQTGEDIVHHFGQRDHIPTGFLRLLVHSLSDEGIVPERFEEGERLVDGIGDVHLRVYEMLEKSLFQGLGQSEHPGCWAANGSPGSLPGLLKGFLDPAGKSQPAQFGPEVLLPRKHREESGSYGVEHQQ